LSTILWDGAAAPCHNATPVFAELPCALRHSFPASNSRQWNDTLLPGRHQRSNARERARGVMILTRLPQKIALTGYKREENGEG
jgi:hypothetical protein